MTWRTRDRSESKTSAAMQRRVTDNTDYEHRYFVNLAATAFILALAVAIGWTLKALDRHLLLEKCLDSGRKECRQVIEPASRVLVLRKY